jgi:hypothetical protein
MEVGDGAVGASPGIDSAEALGGRPGALGAPTSLLPGKIGAVAPPAGLRGGLVGLPAPPPVPKRRALAPLPTWSAPAPAEPAVKKLGEITAGCAGGATTIHASLDIPIELRIGAKVRIESPNGAVQLVTYTGHKSAMNFELRVDSKRSGDIPFRIIVESGSRTWEAAGTAKVARPPPLHIGITTIMGGTKSEDIPFNEELNENSVWTCSFDPPLPEFRASAKRGTIKAHATKPPFRITFSLKEAGSRPVSTLVVIIGERERVQLRHHGNCRWVRWPLVGQSCARKLETNRVSGGEVGFHSRRRRSVRNG